MEEPRQKPDTPVSLFTAFSRILSIHIPANQPAILYKYKTPEKKIAEEIKQKKEQRHKKVQRLLEKKKNYQKATNIVQEKKLRRTALKGVIKLFNEIANSQFKTEEKKIKEGARKQSERFKRRMKRITANSETRKMINYAIEKPKWDVLREDFMKVDSK